MDAGKNELSQDSGYEEKNGTNGFVRNATNAPI